METSDKGVEFLHGVESKRLKAYPDQGWKDGKPRGKWTIGYGTTVVDGVPVHEGMTCTDEQAVRWAREDLYVAENAVRQGVTAPLTQNQFDALVSFVYNVGSGNFARSTLRGVINSGGRVQLHHFTDYNKVWDEEKQSYVVSSGLIARRSKGYDLFSGGNVARA